MYTYSCVYFNLKGIYVFALYILILAILMELLKIMTWKHLKDVIVIYIELMYRKERAYTYPIYNINMNNINM